MSAEHIEQRRRELRALVAALPPAARVTLALGPIAQTAPADVGDCRVCVAVHDLAVVEYLRDGGPALALEKWHRFADFGMSITHGPAVYERCCKIYRAAGWRGPDTVVLGPHEAIR